MKWKNIVPNGTKVRFKDFEDNYIVGIINANDADETDYYRDLNYYVYPIENKEEFLENYGSPYAMLLRKDFKIIREI